MSLEVFQNSEIICFDENGQNLTSRALANTIEAQKMDGNVKHLVFVIGGPYGILPELKKEARRIIKLSDFVLTSDIAFLIAIEQIYRAFNILSNTGYHHD